MQISSVRSCKFAYSRRPFSLQLVLCISILLASVAASAATPKMTATAVSAFSINDYLELRRVTELSLSHDGTMLAYVVEQPSPAENKSIRKVYVSSTARADGGDLIEGIQDARSLAWKSDELGNSQLAFLSSRTGTTQVFTWDAVSRIVQQSSKAPHSVVRFRFSPNGKSLAFTTKENSSRAASLYSRMHSAGGGIVINSDNTSIYNFVDPQSTDQLAITVDAFWIAHNGLTAKAVGAAERATEFHWAPDSRRLAVTFSDPLSVGIIANRRTSVGIIDTTDLSLKMVAQQRVRSGKSSAQYYFGGEWSLDGQSLYLRRVIERDAWMRRIQWASVPLSALKMSKNPDLSALKWHSLDHQNIRGPFISASGNRVFVNETVSAKRALYEIEEERLSQVQIGNDISGSVLLASLSNDMTQVAFVNESLTSPAEIYFWKNGSGSRKITSLNVSISAKTLPRTQEVKWQSKDGTTVQGWLLTPPDLSKNPQPWPMLTHVKGGPGISANNEFASLANLWPYPFESYAMNGIAVLLVNYRGTSSFGAAFMDPRDLDGEPIDDIASGVLTLVKNGVADPHRLAISGHSHGAWLAPLTMTRHRIFCAGSFAEGSGNIIITYHNMRGGLNRDVHDVQYGVSMYENPQRYIGMSPDLHMKELRTATLFEAGAYSQAANMLGMPKAAKHAGMPTEFVVYPQTAHNISNIKQPILWKESATRNLDWFRFWLNGEVDADPAKAAQYERWRAMRKASWEGENANSPTVCKWPVQPSEVTVAR
jgi:dipeptidyl aminopeptidase/acylaminoacyl peptidase